MHRYGHRGGVPQAGENTLASIEAAAEAGYDGVELDVSRAGDGVLVLWHDRTVRVGSVDRPLDQVPSRALPGVASLHEAIPLLVSLGLRTNLDLKLRDPFDLALADEALAALAPLRGRCLVSSFDPRLLRHAATVDPTVPRGIAWAPDLPWTLRSPGLWRWSRATGVHARHDAIDAALVQRAAALGLAITAWNVRDAAPLPRLAALGVKAVIAEGLQDPDQKTRPSPVFTDAATPST